MAAEARELRDKVAALKEIDVAAKNTSKGRGRKRATAASKREAAIESELARGKTSHARQVDAVPQCKANGEKAQANLQNARKHINEVEKIAKLVTAKLKAMLKQFFEAANLTGKVSHWLIVVSKQRKLFGKKYSL